MHYAIITCLHACLHSRLSPLRAGFRSYASLCPQHLKQLGTEETLRAHLPPGRMCAYWLVSCAPRPSVKLSSVRLPLVEPKGAPRVEAKNAVPAWTSLIFVSKWRLSPWLKIYTEQGLPSFHSLQPMGHQERRGADRICDIHNRFYLNVYNVTHWIIIARMCLLLSFIHYRSQLLSEWSRMILKSRGLNLEFGMYPLTQLINNDLIK